jgi:predicted RNA methylase
MSRVRGENDLGQYMTPPEIGRSMFRMFTRPLSEMRLLDPACGDGNLLAVAAQEMKQGGVTDIAHRLAGFDVDGSMLAKTREKLQGILGESAQDAQLSNLDFLALGPFHPAYPEGINAVLSNPPYGGLREYKFFEKCLQIFARGTEMVFLMPLAFVDRTKGIKAQVLKGRPLGVTTGHAIVHHVNGNPVSIAGTRGHQQNSSGFRVLTGVKLYQLGEGDPPQNERIVKDKPFSSTIPQRGWLPCLRTGDIHPFRLSPGRLYVRYGQHLAHPKEIERFVGPKEQDPWSGLLRGHPSLCW